MTNYQSGEYVDRIGRVLAYLDDHLTEEISLEELAGQACFSPYHFHRIFTALIGQTVMAYVRRLRLERAAGLLTFHPSRSITEIALESGFQSSASFAKAFKDHFGCTASQWRAEGPNSKNGQANRKAGKEFLTPSGYGGAVGSGPRLPKITRGGVKMEVTIKDLEAITVAYIRRHGPYDQSMSQVHDRVDAWAEARGLIDSGTKFIGVALDDPEVTPPDRCRYDACVSVPAETEGSGEVKIRTIGGGRHAVVHYDGPAGGIEDAYDFLCGHWLPQSAYQPADLPAYQLYSGSKDDVMRDRHIFDLCLPVKPL